MVKIDMVKEDSHHEFNFELLKILNAPFGSVKSPKTELEVIAPPSIEAEVQADLAELFHDQVIEARYSVFQLILHKVQKLESIFKFVPTKGSAWAYEDDAVRNFLLEFYRLEISKIGQRRVKHLELRRAGNNNAGVAEIYIDEFNGNLRLIVFGAFSLESRGMSSGASSRTDPASSIYFIFDGKDKTAVEEFVKQINITDLTNQAWQHNREVISKIMSKVFPTEVLNKVESHMLSEIEVIKIIDTRKQAKK